MPKDKMKREFGWGLHMIEGPNKPMLAMSVAIGLLSGIGIAIIYNSITTPKTTRAAIGTLNISVVALAASTGFSHYGQR